MKYIWGIAQNISPRLTQEIEKADISGGRGNGQKIQNRQQQKSKIDQGDLEAVKWP
jgi:hypothetical protein